jgi:hypothetical protein
MYFIEATATDFYTTPAIFSQEITYIYGRTVEEVERLREEQVKRYGEVFRLGARQIRNRATRVNDPYFGPYSLKGQNRLLTYRAAMLKRLWASAPVQVSA